jgi:hypothetical protein
LPGLLASLLRLAVLVLVLVLSFAHQTLSRMSLSSA